MTKKIIYALFTLTFGFLVNAQDISISGLKEACDDNNLQLVKDILSKESFENLTKYINKTENDETLLHDIIQQGRRHGIFKLLLNYFDLKSHVTNNKNTILHEIVKRNEDNGHVYINNIFMMAKKQRIIDNAKMKKRIKSALKIAKKQKAKKEIKDALKNYKNFYTLQSL